MGDVCPHHQGVKGIGFPWFPHLRPTEAREQCELCCLSVPVCPPTPPRPPNSVSCSLCQLQSHHFPPPPSFIQSFTHILPHSRFHLFVHSCHTPFFSFAVTVPLSFSLARHYHTRGGAAMLRGLLGLPAAFLRLCRSTLRSSLRTRCY